MPKSLYQNICDQLLFSKLYEKYAQSLSNILFYKYGDLLNPADKVQDAFIKLWENCAKVTPESAKSYLYTIANNMMLNEAKHQKVVLKHQEVKPKDYTNESPEFILRKKEFLKRIPLKRYGKVSEISSVVEMLSSDGGGYITGQNIRVDGGITRSV